MYLEPHLRYILVNLGLWGTDGGVKIAATCIIVQINQNICNSISSSFLLGYTSLSLNILGNLKVVSVNAFSVEEMKYSE